MRAFPAVLAAAGLALVAPPAVSAQEYSGTYTTPNTGGGIVTLVLNQDAQGRVSGSMSSQGVSFAINAMVERGTVVGMMSGDGMSVYFGAEMSGTQLTVTLMEPGPDNQPNYQSAQRIEFVRQGGGMAGAPSGRKPPPTPVPSPPPGRPAPGVAPGNPGGAGGSALPGWNIHYSVPANWQVSQRLGRVHALSSMNEAGAIFVAPGLYSNFNEIQTDLGVFYQSMNLMASPVEQPRTTTVAGMQAMTATYASYDQRGQMVHGRVVALLSPHGTGFVVLGMTTPQMMPGLARTVEQIAGAVRVSGPPEVNYQLVQALRGRWMFYEGRASPTTGATGGSSRSYEEWVEFDGQGQYAWQSSASVSVTTPGYSGGAGGANANNDRGTYTVIGNTLVVRGQNGQLAYDIQLAGNRLVAGGKTYVRN